MHVQQVGFLLRFRKLLLPLMLCFRYTTCLAELLSEVVCKIQFHLNESWLSEIDLETLDDDVCILSDYILLHFSQAKMSR